jgi:putative ABC transport system permease protein
MNWKAIFRRKKLEGDLDEEIHSHLAMEIRQRIERGESPEQAHVNATKTFGNVNLVKEITRDVWGQRLLDEIRRDLVYAVRTLLWRTPAFTAIAICSIALGVAATAVVYTAIKAVLIKPLPYVDAEQLVQFRTDFSNDLIPWPSRTDWIFWHDGQEIIRRSQTLQSVGIYGGNSVINLEGDASSPPEALYGVRMSASLFPTLGVSPMLGRIVLPEEDQPGRPKQMILSYGLWVRRFNADRNIVGQTVKIDNGEDCLIIGVMPPDFNFPLRRQATRTPQPYVEFYTALRLDPVNPAADRGALGAIARLRPGVTLAQAQQDLAGISSALRREFPESNRDRTLQMGLLWNRQLGAARNALWLLMAAATMFLLIGCANVANLLLVRGFARQREIAIRMAIGASRSRIFRQCLTESCLLAVVGGFGGYLLTAVAWRILPTVAPVNIPRLSGARADGAILTFALAAALINGILFGMAPALRAIRRERGISGCDLGARGAASGRADPLRGFLVIAEVAVSVTLVVIGGQLLGSFIDLVRTDTGFQANRILGAVVLTQPPRYATPEKRASAYRRFVEAVRTLPGVESVGTVDALPFSGENHGGYLSLRENPALRDQMVAEVDIVSANYLQTMGIRLSEGRLFNEQDMEEPSGIVIVDEVAANRLWPGTSPIGKPVCVNCTAEKPRNWKQVVGVVASMRHSALDGPLQANAYLSGGALEHAQFLVVRANRPTAELEKPIRVAIASVDPQQPVLLSASMESFVADSVADRRFIMSLLSVTACLALVMAAAGVYGVTLYTTSRRTQEIGIRMALGATAHNINALLFRQGFLTVGIGLALGAASTLALMRALRGLVVGLEGVNPIHAFAAILIVSFAVALACWVPARRATVIDPMAVLRQE